MDSIEKNEFKNEKLLSVSGAIKKENLTAFDGFDGALAQLVERHNGIVEVSGSTPLCSTITAKDKKALQWRAFFILKTPFKHTVFSHLSQRGSRLNPIH